ncbi:MAG: hypothetical protein IJZ02_09370 [Clostridia bacterium]|nr:hypothetical protein [Clostridia bacterium]
MHHSCHEVTFADGSVCDVYVLADEDFVVFGTEPGLGPDLSRLCLGGARRSIHYRLENGQLRLESLMGEFRCRLFRALPVIDGVKAMRSCEADNDPPCDNPRMWQYTFHRLADFTGTMLIGRDFDPRFWPKDDRITPVPCTPEVYRRVERLHFAAGRLVRRERVK